MFLVYYSSSKWHFLFEKYTANSHSFVWCKPSLAGLPLRSQEQVARYGLNVKIVDANNPGSIFFHIIPDGAYSS